MNPGRLRHRVRIEKEDYLRDSHGDIIRDPITGETSRGWVEVATVWAAVEPLQGREFFESGAVQSQVTTRIRMRYRPGLTPAMRLVHGDDVHEIEAIIDPQTRHEQLQIMCKRLGA